MDDGDNIDLKRRLLYKDRGHLCKPLILSSRSSIRVQYMFALANDIAGIMTMAKNFNFYINTLSISFYCEVPAFSLMLCYELQFSKDRHSPDKQSEV